MDIHPIETLYKGYRFRSRLEARWAVFFDALGLEWEYEKEGYDLGDAGWYLPDFWLPEHGWVEVKPQVKIPPDEWGKIRAFAEANTQKRIQVLWGQPDIPEITSSLDNNMPRCKYFSVVYGMVTVNDVTRPFLDHRPWYWHERTLDHSFVIWPIPSLEPITEEEMEKRGRPGIYVHIKGQYILCTDPLLDGSKSVSSKAIIDAVRASRSARFEHGESGAA